jgi:hypothetical protein
MSVRLGVTLRKEHMLMVFGNRALREVSEPKSVQVKRDSRKLCNEEFIDLRPAEKVIYL